jgi:hypothetical protein
MKKSIRKTSGTRNRYKPGQLVTINHRVFRIVKNYWCLDNCLRECSRDYEKYSFCMELPLGFSLKPISKHKG